MIKRGTASDKEWYNEWSFWLNFFFFFQIREEPITKHPNEDPLKQRMWKVT